MSHELTLKLLVIISCFAALTFAGSRKWLRPLETTILGIAIIFWATGWLLQTLMPKVAMPIYGPGWHALLLAAAMTLPMTLALSVGLWLLVRRMRRSAGGPSTPPSPLPRRKKKTKR